MFILRAILLVKDITVNYIVVIGIGLLGILLLIIGIFNTIGKIDLCTYFILLYFWKQYYEVLINWFI